MTLQTVQAVRLAFGVWGAVALSYGISWQLSFVAPIFATIFLLMPAWIGWKMAFQMVCRLICSLLLGLLISEILLLFPLICILIYGLLFFLIYYNDTPSSPPFSTMFMTLGITFVPMMGLSGAVLSHFIALALLINFCLGLFFAWVFHRLLPNSLAEEPRQEVAGKKPELPQIPSREIRVEHALMSTVVALSAVILFFMFNLSAYAYAMIQICFMVGSPDANASFAAMKANALACCIGGAFIIVVFNLLVAVPTYPFLLALTLLVFLFFSGKIYGGGPSANVFIPGLTTFLVLLGTSTMVDKLASTNFYMRISLILFAGLFAVGGLVLIDHILSSKKAGSSGSFIS